MHLEVEGYAASFGPIQYSGLKSGALKQIFSMILYSGCKVSLAQVNVAYAMLYIQDEVAWLKLWAAGVPESIG